MNVMRALRALGPIDAKSVRRDSFLRWMLLYPIALALLIRWGLPVLTEFLRQRYDFELIPYYTLIMSFCVELVPMFIGMVIGFLLLDQRDDHTLSALQVTPLSLPGYLAYRIALPMSSGLMTTMLFFPLAGWHDLSLLMLFFVALGAVPLAPIFALFLATFSENKVQGFALTKALGVVLWPPIVAYFLPGYWQWLIGVIPTFWPVKAFWMVHNGSAYWWVVLLIGFAYQICLLGLLLRRFENVMRR
ncbi:MAG TPA: hypothetical protein VGA99_07285 [bacterium]